ncbi:MAG: hypothetical protein DRQ44_18475 [Gammaproteobacteria bacterium]|nr:MAG: hypothetical protein DRQ44_18475 [Gammaproteobacteria bacterium]
MKNIIAINIAEATANPACLLILVIKTPFLSLSIYIDTFSHYKQNDKSLLRSDAAKLYMQKYILYNTTVLKSSYMELLNV